jgi:EmrB/QacA subfamily drug resistance transporter
MIAAERLSSALTFIEPELDSAKRRTPISMNSNLTPSEARAVITGALLAVFLSALDQMIIATAMPAIARDLGDLSLISWIVTSYLLTSTCATTIVGKLSDLYGRRWSLIACLSIFIVGSALCALATEMIPLILARALQGLGGGGLITLGHAVIADMFAPRERGRYAALFSTVYASASVLGPILGGVLTEYAGWPWVFWINLPLGLIALVIADRGLRKLPVQHRRSAIDYRSIFVLTSATVALLLVVSLGGKRLPWAAPETLALGAAALLLTALFALMQRRATEPILPPRFLADRVIGPLLAVSFVAFGAFTGVTAFVPVYFQVALGASVSEAGLLLIPVMVSASIGATFAARYARRSGRYKLPPLISLPFAVLAMAGLAYFADRLSAPVTSAVLMIMGFGIGPAFSITSVAGQNAAGQRDIGAVTGALAFSRALGGAIAVAAASAIVLGFASDALPAFGLGSGLEGLFRETLTQDARLIVARAFGVMFGVAAFAYLVGLLIFIRVEDRELRGRETAAPSSA